MTTTQQAPASIITTAAFFDPFECASKMLTTSAILQAVQSSLCWYADGAYMRELRTVFWTGFDDVKADDVSVEYNDFIARMSEREFAQKITYEQGFEVGSGPTIVRQLARLRAAWYDDMNAQSQVPSLEDLLANERAPRVGVIQHERLAMLAEHMSDDVDERKVLLANLVKREEAQSHFAHTNRQRMNACLHLIASFCENTDTDANEFHFHQLPDMHQKRLIMAVPQILSRVILQMSRDRKMSTLEYSACMIEATRTTKHFNQVLNLPRWARVEA